MKHYLRVVVVVGIAVLALIPQSAGAVRPVRTPLPPFVFSFVPGTPTQLCDFQVDTAPAGATQTETDFVDQSGKLVRITFTGTNLISLTNHATGKTIVLNANGQGTLYPQPDGSFRGAGGGPGLFGLFQGDDRGPALILINGHESFTITPDGHIRDLVIVGTVTDMCAVLAA